MEYPLTLSAPTPLDYNFTYQCQGSKNGGVTERAETMCRRWNFPRPFGPQNELSQKQNVPPMICKSLSL